MEPDGQFTIEDALTEQPMSTERESQRRKVLAALRLGGTRGVMNHDLNKICFRYAARIHELRKQGHDIRTHRKGGEVYFTFHEGDA